MKFACAQSFAAINLLTAISCLSFTYALPRPDDDKAATGSNGVNPFKGSGQRPARATLHTDANPTEIPPTKFVMFRALTNDLEGNLKSQYDAAKYEAAAMVRIGSDIFTSIEIRR
jgi:hypothetical protein